MVKRSTSRGQRFKHLALACAALATGAHAAGTFTVSPVRIFMSPKDRAVAITVTNDGNEELVMQAEVFAWGQKPGGEDELVPSEDLILSPPILKMAPKSRQVVRLALIQKRPLDKQITYRLVVREVPEVKQAERDINMQVALAFSMPVFISPPGAKRNVMCEADRAAADTVRVSCANSGTAYAQVREVVFTSPSGERIAGRDVGGYILPGITRAFPIRKDGGFAAGAYKLGVSFDDGSAQSFDVTVPQ